MKTIRIAILLAAICLAAAPSFAQSAGAKDTGPGGTNGQQGPSTGSRSGGSGH